MKKIKVVIIILSFSIVSIMIYLFLNSKNIAQQENMEAKTENVSKVNLEKLENDSTYFTIKKCIETYVEKIKTEDRKALLEILNSEYVEEKNINESNIFNYIDTIKETSEIKINKVLIKEKDEYLSKYYVLGDIRNKGDEGKNRNNIYLTIDINLKSNEFFITPDILDKGVFDE